MALSDILAKLKDAATSPTGEGVLSAIPLLVGSYESGHGQPIGGPLQTLGELGFQNAANRQVEHQNQADVASRLDQLAARGLLPGGQDFYKGGLFNPRVSAQEGQNQLTDIETQELAQQKQGDELLRLKDGRAFWINKRTHAYTAAPEFDIDPNKLKNPAHMTDEEWARQSNPGMTWNDYQNAKNKFSEAKNRQQVADRVKTVQDFMLARPSAIALKGQVVFRSDPNDPDWLKPIQLKNTLTEYNPDTMNNMKMSDYQRYVVPVVQLRNSLGNLARTARLTAPHEYKSPIANYLSGIWNAIQSGVYKYTDKDYAVFGGGRSEVALQLQKVLTGSTRPMNAIEFNRVIGAKLDKVGDLDNNDVAALVPTARDAMETRAAKMKYIDDLTRGVLGSVSSGTPAQQIDVSKLLGAAGLDSGPATTETPEAPPPEEPEPVADPDAF